nr:hypothetical protein Iba_chr03bCG5640 [Ipomoea batatas]
MGHNAIVESRRYELCWSRERPRVKVCCLLGCCRDRRAAMIRPEVRLPLHCSAVGGEDHRRCFPPPPMFTIDAITP